MFEDNMPNTGAATDADTNTDAASAPAEGGDTNTDAASAPAEGGDNQNA